MSFKGYCIKASNFTPKGDVQEVLSVSLGEWVIASDCCQFPTLREAVYYWNMARNLPIRTQVWIEGPRGGRYAPSTGRKLR